MALPADRVTMIEDICQRKADRFQKWEDDLWESGLGPFGKAKPQERLKWYMAQTLPQDFGMVLDMDYREKRKNGLAGPLAVELQFQQYQQHTALVSQAQVEAESMGVGMPQVPEMPVPPMMWVQLMGMSGRFMQKVQSDFRALLNEQAKREGLMQPQVSQPVEAY